MRFSPRRIRRRLSLAPLAAVLAVAGVSAAKAGEYTKTYPISGRVEVRIRTDDGNVRVVTSDQDQVEFRVKYDVSPWRLGFSSDPHVDSDMKGHVVELNARAGWGVGIGIGGRSMAIEVRMPKDADLQLETVDGRVDVASLDGHVVAHSVDGGIHVSQLTGTLDIRSTDGAITASSLKGDVKLQTVDGSISGSNLDGACVASTKDGAVHVSGRFDSLDLRTGDGMVVARAESGSRMASPWRIQSVDGAVRVALPSDLKANLDASTSNGHINVDLPIEARGTVSKTEFHGLLNGGGPAVMVQTADGSIDLSHL